MDPTDSSLVASDPLVLTKFNPNGELLWQRRAEAASDSVSYQGLAVDARGNCYAAGLFMSRFVEGEFQPGTVSFGASTATTAALFDMFLVKFSASGELRWLAQTVGLDPRQSGFPDRISDTRVTALVVDPRGSGILIGGGIRGTVEFGAIALNGPGWGAGGLGVFAARLAEPASIAVELNVVRAGSRLAISWPSSVAGFMLESADTLPAESWATVAATPTVEGDQNLVTVDTSAGQRFFRLRKP